MKQVKYPALQQKKSRDCAAVLHPVPLFVPVYVAMLHPVLLRMQVCAAMLHPVLLFVLVCADVYDPDLPEKRFWVRLQE